MVNVIIFCLFFYPQAFGFSSIFTVYKINDDVVSFLFSLPLYLSSFFFYSFPFVAQIYESMELNDEWTGSCGLILVFLALLSFLLDSSSAVHGRKYNTELERKKNGNTYTQRQ